MPDYEKRRRLSRRCYSGRHFGTIISTGSTGVLAKRQAAAVCGGGSKNKAGDYDTAAKVPGAVI